MKKFVFYILKVIFAVVLIAYTLDFLYTIAYEKSTGRNKIQAIVNAPKSNLDVLILGSSRANNHFVTAEFEKQKIKAFNFGMSGATLEESALMLKFFIANKWQIQNVLLEVDLNLNSEGFSDGTRALFMPFLRNPIVRDYYKSSANFNEMYSIPFYRYTVYESKIGLRELFFSIINKKSNCKCFS